MTGFFGKIPAHGDFVTRDVSQEFLGVWDRWLQQAITTSKEQLDDSWLDIYLTSPIWHFVLLGGICGTEASAGIMMPSVDRVGRYFPLTIVTPLHGEINAFQLAADECEWFAAADAVALRTLNSPRMDADELHACVSGLVRIRQRPAVADGTVLVRARAGGYASTGWPVEDVAGLLAHEAVREQGPYSFWWTGGSDAARPLTLVTTGLPAPEVFSELLSAAWAGGTAPRAGAALAGLHKPEVSSARARGPFQWFSVSRTETGNVREANEDACLELPASGLWAVADGMGGHSDGQVASHTVIEALSRTQVPPSLGALLDDVEDRVLEANQRLYRSSLDGECPKVVGCTVAALLAHRSHCIGLWAGDSRIYRLRGGLLEKITRDHSEAEEARDSGRTQGAADESVITRAVGASDTLFLDLEAHELQHGDRFLICSDGLYRELVDDELRELLARGSCEQACSALLDAALRRQCTDNATAVVVEFADARR